MTLLKIGDHLINADNVTHVTVQSETVGGATSRSSTKPAVRSTVIYFVGGQSVKFAGETAARSLVDWYNAKGFLIVELPA